MPRKVVFSRTLKTAEWANTTIAAGETAEEIDQLRQGGDGHIVVWGGVSPVVAALATPGVNRLVKGWAWVLVTHHRLGTALMDLGGVHNRSGRLPWLIW